MATTPVNTGSGDPGAVIVDVGQITVAGEVIPKIAAVDPDTGTAILPASQADVAAIVTALGTPAQAGGNVSVSSSALPSGAATEASLDSINQKTPSLQLGTVPVSLPISSGSRGNLLPFDFGGWTVGADSAVSADATGLAPLAGVSSWFKIDFTSASGQGIYVTRTLTGRSDGARLMFSCYVRNRGASARDFKVQLRTDDGSSQDYIYPTDASIPNDSVWRRVAFQILVNISSATQAIMRIYGMSGQTYSMDIACPHLEQTESLTPSDFQPPLFNSVQPSLQNVPRVSVAMYGDSLTDGAGGTNMRGELSRLLNGSVIYNGGIGSETSTQIRDRMVPVNWAISTAYTLGQYRKNGSNIYKVTTAGTSAGSGGPTGTGTGIVDGSVVWSYYGSASDPGIYTRYGVVVIEAGRNNMASVSTVLADIAAMVAAVPHGRYLVMEVWNATTEPLGGATYGAMQQINEALSQRYGSRLVRWRRQFTAGSPTDIPQTNLMYDTVHPNQAGWGILAWALYGAMHSNGYLPLAFGSQRAPQVGQADIPSSQPVNLPANATILSTAGQSTLNLDLLTEGASGWFPAHAFHSCSMQIIASAGISAGAIFFEQTNDPTNANAGNIWPVEETTTLTPTPQIAAITIAASARRAFGAPITMNYVRVRISTAFVGGTVRIAASFSQLPYTRMIQTVAQATAGNLNGTMAISGTPTVTPAPSTSQGSSTNHRTAFVANITTGVPTSVKASAGVLNSGRIANKSGTDVWFHLYNLAAAPTLGTSTPEESFLVPAGGTLILNCGPFSERFATGIAYAITDNCAAVPAVGGTITIASTTAAICVSLRYT